MGLRKWLSLLQPKREAQRETQLPSTAKAMPVKIIMQPDMQTSQSNLNPLPEPIIFREAESKQAAIIPQPARLTPSKPGTIEEPAEALDESEFCEDPEPMRQFHAVNVEVATRKASEKELIILFQEMDKCDLYGRKRVYWALPRETVEKLLKCVSDLKSAAEFTAEEKEVLRSMVAKRWIKLMRDGKETYYYGLDPRTAANLNRQIRFVGKK